MTKLTDDKPSKDGRIGAGVDRRAFLTGAGTAGAAAATGAAALETVREPPSEQIEGRYRLTEHVERFYFLNRL